MLSVAHEDVIAFSQLSSRPSDEGVGGPLFQMREPDTSPETVADAGRRAITTTARLAAANGLAGLSSARIRKDAGLSRREFERHFGGVEDCFLDAVEAVAKGAARAAGTSAEGVDGWERRNSKMFGALCSLAARDRHLSRLVLLDVTAPGLAGSGPDEAAPSACPGLRLHDLGAAPPQVPGAAETPTRSDHRRAGDSADRARRCGRLN